MPTPIPFTGNIPLYEGNVPNRLDSPETFSSDTDYYHAWLPSAVEGMNAVAAAMNLNATNSSSTTSLLIGTGSKSLIVETNKGYIGGMYITLADTAAPSTNSMVAQVTSYNTTTGAMVVNSLTTAGSGTKTAWTISQSSKPLDFVALAADTGAALIGFKQSGSGAVSTTIDAVLNESVSVFRFMTPAQIADVKARTALVDVTGAIQVAVNAAMLTGAKLVFHTGVYRVDTSISNTTGGDIDIEFEEGAVIDGTSSTATTLLTLGGSIGSSTPLSIDAEKGAISINVAGNTYVSGDVLKVSSTALWNPNNVNYIKGEMCRVLYVAGDVVTLTSQLYDSYTAATTVVAKYTMGGCRISGLEIKRNSNHAGLALRYVKDFELRKIQVTGANERNIYLKESFNGTVDLCTARSIWYTGTGTAYGLAIDSCQYLSVNGGEYVGGRHGVSTGGTFPCRKIVFNGVTISNDPAQNVTYGFDTHPNGEFIDVINCTSNNGAGFQSINTRVIGGTYRSKTYTSVALVLMPEVSGDYLEVKDLYAENFGGMDAVRVSLAENGLTFNRVDIDNITAPTSQTTSNSGGVITVRLNNAGHSGTIKKINISKAIPNIKVAPTSPTYGISIGTTGTLTADVNLTGNFTDNSVHNTRSIIIDVIGTIKSTDNHWRAAEISSYNLYVVDGDFYSTKDTFDGAGVNGYSYITSTGKVKFIEPIFKGQTALGGLRVTAATDVQISNPTKIGTTGVFTIDATHAYSDISSAMTKTLYRNAVPTLGTWAVGDTVVNSVPAVGAFKEQKCTVAGAPGTWVSTGNL